MRHVCTICGGHRTRRRWVLGAAAVHRCLDCAAGFLHPRPTPEELHAFYDNDYVSMDIDEVRGGGAERARLLDLLEREVPPGRLLELGCSFGFLLDAARRRGWDPRGVELAEGPARHAEEHFGLAVVRGSAEGRHVPAASCDAVVLNHVFEHLPAPRAALAEVRRALRPGGVLLIAVPNADSLEARLAGGGWGWLDPPAHLHHFGPAGLRRLIEEAGFEVREIVTARGSGRGGYLLAAALGVRYRLRRLLGRDTSFAGPRGGADETAGTPGNGTPAWRRLLGRLSLGMDRVLAPVLRWIAGRGWEANLILTAVRSARCATLETHPVGSLAQETAADTLEEVG